MSRSERVLHDKASPFTTFLDSTQIVGITYTEESTQICRFEVTGDDDPISSPSPPANYIRAFLAQLIIREVWLIC